MSEKDRVRDRERGQEKHGGKTETKTLHLQPDTTDYTQGVLGRTHRGHTGQTEYEREQNSMN